MSKVLLPASTVHRRLDFAAFVKFFGIAGFGRMYGIVPSGRILFTSLMSWLSDCTVTTCWPRIAPSPVSKVVSS